MFLILTVVAISAHLATFIINTVLTTPLISHTLPAKTIHLKIKLYRFLLRITQDRMEEWSKATNWLLIMTSIISMDTAKLFTLTM